jgi:hypothetical protein
VTAFVLHKVRNSWRICILASRYSCCTSVPGNTGQGINSNYTTYWYSHLRVKNTWQQGMNVILPLKTRIALNTVIKWHKNWARDVAQWLSICQHVQGPGFNPSHFSTPQKRTPKVTLNVQLWVIRQTWNVQGKSMLQSLYTCSCTWHHQFSFKIKSIGCG